MTEKEITTRALDPRLMARLLSYLRPYARWVVLTFGLIVAGSIVSQAGPYLTKVAVDEYIAAGDRAGLGRLILLYGGLLVLQFVLQYGRSWATHMVGQWAMRDVRLQIFRHLQRLPVRYFDRTPLGRLMARNTNDVAALNELFTDGVVSLCSDLFTLLTILGYILFMNVQLGLLTAAVLPLAAAATVWLQRRTFHAYRSARTRFAAFAASLQETISGIEVVQLFSAQERSRRQFDQENDRYLDARLTSTLYHSMYFPFMEFSGTLLLALVLWYGTGEVLRETMQWGVLVAMLQYVPRFFMPIRDMAERYATLQVAMASSERIFEILDTSPELTGGAALPASLRGDIEFRNVWFAYEDEDWVLRDVSFRAEPGKSLAIVGATGAGKSTIIGVLCRFYDIQRGVILVDGVDVREWDARELRRRIGVVHQDVFLFSGTIERNIALAETALRRETVEQSGGAPRHARQRNASDQEEAEHAGNGSGCGRQVHELDRDQVEPVGGSPDRSQQTPGPDRARVERAAIDANADRSIRRLPDGYDHVIGERGASLSAGQRQLLSFARALASNPQILVLDEATASVDTETETWIQEAVGRLMSGRTSIVIAHRLSTIRSADRILVLHRGKVRESGSHEELLQRRGVYFRLHQLQYSGEAARSTGFSHRV